MVYAVFGAAWIFFSDTLLHAMVQDPDLEARLQTYKGWAYVAVTGGLVYVLIRQYANALHEKIRESERIRAELLDSERTLSRHIQNTPLGCVSWNRDFVCTEWNKSAEAIFGYTAEQAIGKKARELVVPEAIKGDIDNIFAMLLEQKGGSRNINPNVTRDGRTIICEWYNTPIVNQQNEVVGVASLVMDITGNKQTEEMMFRAKEDALAASKAKSEFLATMSHEFRTPLNAILGFSEMMQLAYSGQLSPEKYTDYANDIHQSGKHMLSLVNDVLDVSEIEAGERRINKKPVDISAILSAAIRNLMPAAQKAGIAMTLSLPDTLPAFSADLRSINQIILNLLSNAVKFTHAGGRIDVSAGVSDGALEISVKDTGIGIPAEKLPLICEPFSRLNDDPHTAQYGTGLGLSIVKALVDIHDGTIRFESEVGVGTTVIVTLPLDVPGAS